jgi:hypothetical protein
MLTEAEVSGRRHEGRGSLEVRNVPETGAEFSASSTSAFQRTCRSASVHDGCVRITLTSHGNTTAAAVWARPAFATEGSVEFVKVFAEVERPNEPLQ